MRALVADDSSIPRDILRSVLAFGGFEVVAICTNGREAVEAAREHRPDIAILDISMPVMTGLEAAQIIVGEKLATKVIVASNMGQDAIRDALSAIGVRFVSKPYNKDRFLRELLEVMGEA